jgi:hypothetical protein
MRLQVPESPAADLPDSRALAKLPPIFLRSSQQHPAAFDDRRGYRIGHGVACVRAVTSTDVD